MIMNSIAKNDRYHLIAGVFRVPGKSYSVAPGGGIAGDCIYQIASTESGVVLFRSIEWEITAKIWADITGCYRETWEKRITQ